MDGITERTEIVLLFERYNEASRSLHESFQLSGCDCKAVVIEEDGFLPEDVMSVYGFFLGSFDSVQPGRPRYFNEIPVPEYWEIKGNNKSGRIMDLYRERGRIFYAEPLHKRQVRVVDWYDERKVARTSDHYNRRGALYARTIFNDKEQKVTKSYFSASGKEIIVENFVTGDIILNEDSEVKIFRSKTELTVYFLKTTGLAQCRLFFNSLSTPFFVSQRLTAQSKQDALFWQESTGDSIPGNMQIILNGQASRTETVFVQRQASYDKLIALGANAQKVHKLGFIYPFVRENNHRASALICTNSDRIEQIDRLVKELPQVHFRIAALTEMSPKLMSMGSFENVSLYPGVKMPVLEELFSECDIYLDINYEAEIVSAVRKAFLHNQLIFAFKETLHNRDYVAKEHIFEAGKCEELMEALKLVLTDEKQMDEGVLKQRAAALAETAEQYKKFY